MAHSIETETRAGEPFWVATVRQVRWVLSTTVAEMFFMQSYAPAACAAGGGTCRSAAATPLLHSLSNTGGVPAAEKSAWMVTAPPTAVGVPGSSV